MGTPIRQIISSKILSPFSSSISYKLNVNNKCQKTTLKSGSGSKDAKKFLNFETSASSSLRSPSSLYHNIKINVTNYSKKTLIVNTPNKEQLMNKGLNTESNLNILGKGSFGTVVRGIYKDKNVAVKIVKLQENKKFSPRERNVLNFSHENVVKIIDIIFKENTNYGIIIMEYLKSVRHLQSILDDKNTVLSCDIVVKLASDISKGLQYCHENKVIHLDLKPSNILVCQDFLCKLCDFGNSVYVDDFTQFTSCQGTVGYTAPELLSGKPPTSKCDVYSLGIVLWQIRHRMIPYSDVNRTEVIIYKVVKFEYRPDSIKPEISDDYSLIYCDCWAPNPDDRPDVSTIIIRLNRIVY